MEDAAVVPLNDAFESISDVLPLVFSLLGPTDLCRVARTSRYLRAMADDANLWRDCVAEDKSLGVTSLTLVDGNNWKEVFKTKRKVAKLEEWLASPQEGDALLLPSGRYPGMSVQNITTKIAFIGMVNRSGDTVLIQGSPPNNLIELSGPSVVFRNITFRFPETPAPATPLRAWPAAIYIASGRLEMDDCRLEGGARQWGVAAQHKASVQLRRCTFVNFLDSPLALWDGCVADVDECDFQNVGQLQVRSATVRLRRTTVLLKDVYEARLCFVGPGSSGTFEDCRFMGRGHRCSGVSSWGAVELRRCVLDGFYFALTKREQPPVSVAECKFLAHARGGNAFLSSARGPTTFTQCEFSGAFTSAIEVEENGSLHMTQCRFTKAQCAVGLHGKDTDGQLEACIFRECEVALKVGVSAHVEPRDCSFVRCERGVHLTGDANALTNEGPRLKQLNTFERCGTAVHIEPMEGAAEGEGADAIDAEVKQAIAKGVCTYQVTGPHYRRQMVWRCNTCRLNNSRGVCIVCMQRCHAGHELEPTPETVRFFCDCGAERFCETLRRAAPLNSSIN